MKELIKNLQQKGYKFMIPFIFTMGFTVFIGSILIYTLIPIAILNDIIAISYTLVLFIVLLKIILPILREESKKEY